jgi:hypothetical protein
VRIEGFHELVALSHESPNLCLCYATDPPGRGMKLGGVAEVVAVPLAPPSDWPDTPSAWIADQLCHLAPPRRDDTGGRIWVLTGHCAAGERRPWLTLFDAHVVGWLAEPALTQAWLLLHRHAGSRWLRYQSGSPDR